MRSPKTISIIAWIGLSFLMVPVVFTVVISVVASLMENTFHFDYLMTAELGWMVIIGLLGVVYASHATKINRRFIFIASGLAMLALIFLMAYPALSDVGDFRLDDPEVIMLLGVVALYNVAFIGAAIASYLMIRRFRHGKDG